METGHCRSLKLKWHNLSLIGDLLSSSKIGSNYNVQSIQNTTM